MWLLETANSEFWSEVKILCSCDRMNITEQNVNWYRHIIVHTYIHKQRFGINSMPNDQCSLCCAWFFPRSGTLDIHDLWPFSSLSLFALPWIYFVNNGIAMASSSVFQSQQVQNDYDEQRMVENFFEDVINIAEMEAESLKCQQNGWVFCNKFYVMALEIKHVDKQVSVHFKVFDWLIGWLIDWLIIDWLDWSIDRSIIDWLIDLNGCLTDWLIWGFIYQSIHQSLITTHLIFCSNNLHFRITR